MTHPITRQGKGGRETFLPLRQGYAVNAHKVQGLEYPHVTVWFDAQHAPPGVGYMAVPRTGSLKSLAFLGAVTACHFVPVTKWE